MRCAVRLGALLALVTLAVFWRVQDAGFLGYDDDLYVTANPNVLEGLRARNLLWAFQTTVATNWHPLTWLSHMLDVELFGVDASAHHRTSLILHAANALLLMLLLAELTGAPWPSFLAAALFALHPLHTESVAWVAERKDLLSTSCWFASTLAWARFARGSSRAAYASALVFYAAGLMAKPMLVTLPFTLLLLDVWPLRRLAARRRLIVEKLPFFALAALSSAITFAVQRRAGQVAPLDALPVHVRLLTAALGTATYLRQTLWPADLAVFYPYPRLFRHTHWIGAVVLLAGLSALALRQLRRRPYLFTGWFWFAGTLVPVSGIVQVGYQSHADRYTYVPLVGLFVAIAFGAAELARRGPAARRAVAAVSAAALIACAALSWRQVGYWRDDEALFQRALAVTEDNFIAHHHLANWHRRQGHAEAALAHYSEAIRIYPGYVLSQLFAGEVLLERGELEPAAERFRAVLQLAPQQPSAHNALGYILGRRGDLEGAIGHFGAAVAALPEHERYYVNLRAALVEYRRRRPDAPLPEQVRLLRREDAAALASRTAPRPPDVRP